MAKGISEEEFSQLQNQFLELKTVNYALEDKNKKQAAAVADLEARLRRSVADATRLQTVVDKSRRARDTEQLVAANLSLEQKLVHQEEEFRLQNQTLLQELSTYVADNERLTSELAALDGGRSDKGPPAEEVLHLRAESAALRAELEERSGRAEAELAELRSKVTALTESNVLLEKACRPAADSPPVDDADFVEVSSAEVCYKKAAAGAQQLLQAAESRLQLLQTDLQQSADMRLTLETTRRELELYRQEARRQRDHSASGGEEGELRQKLVRKQESYQALQAEMESLRQTLESEVTSLQQQRQQDAEEARARTQRYQTQLNNGYSVLKAEREQTAATIQALTERLAQYEPTAAGDSGSPVKSAAAPPQHPTVEKLAEVEARLTDAETKLAQSEAGRTETSSALAEAEARLKQAQVVRAEKEARLVEAGDRLGVVEAALSAAEAKMAETEAALIEATNSRNDANKLASKRKSLLDEMAAHIERLAAEHAERLRTSDEARHQAQTLADARQQRLKELESAVEAAEVARTQAEEQLQQERRQLQELQRRQQQVKQDHGEQLQLLRQEVEQLQHQHREETQQLTEKHQAELKDVSTQLEISSALQAESRDKVAALRQEVKDSVDEKRIHERKGAAITKDLRRQLAQERRRADRLQQALQEAPLTAAAAGTPTQNASVSPPAEDAQSVSSWSLMSGENGAPSAAGSGGSPVDTETVSLLARITRLQEEKWRLEEKLNHLEENSGALADDLANKAALIQFYCMEGRPAPSVAGPRRQSTAGKTGAAAEAAVVAPVKKLVEFVKHLSLDEQQRDMQRRMQRMLEETLTRNMHLQKDLQAMSDQLQAVKAPGAPPAAADHNGQ